MQNTKSPILPNDIDKYVTHYYADNNGVRIHYVTIDEGQTSIVMIHGFPDFWYTWRNQMIALMSKYQVAAIDLRGYNLSDKPQGGEYYLIRHLISDIQAVIRHLEKDKAVIMGHDWGGAIAWFFAMHFPTMTERLIVLNFPHPSGFIRELAQNSQQQKQSAYARDFQQEGALVLTDIRMDDIDGFKLSKLIHQMDEEIKIIGISAFEFYDSDLKQTPIDELLKKPIHIADLINVIKKHLLAAQCKVRTL